MHKAGPTGRGGWSYEGNTLTTVISTASYTVESRVIVEVRRAHGMTAPRGELDGFVGAMSRLRGAYDAMNQTLPASYPPDPLVDAMQSGDRLGYHPEKIVEELTHFREVLPQAQSAVDKAAKDLTQHMNDPARTANRPPAAEARKQHRLEAAARAQKLTTAAAEEVAGSRQEDRK